MRKKRPFHKDSSHVLLHGCLSAMAAQPFWRKVPFGAALCIAKRCIEEGGYQTVLRQNATWLGEVYWLKVDEREVIDAIRVARSLLGLANVSDGDQIFIVAMNSELPIKVASRFFAFPSFEDVTVIYPKVFRKLLKLRRVSGTRLARLLQPHPPTKSNCVLKLRILTKSSHDKAIGGAFPDLLSSAWLLEAVSKMKWADQIPLNRVLRFVDTIQRQRQYKFSLSHTGEVFVFIWVNSDMSGEQLISQECVDICAPASELNSRFNLPILEVQSDFLPPPSEGDFVSDAPFTINDFRRSAKFLTVDPVGRIVSAEALK